VREREILKKYMKREKNSESEGELKKMEDERGRGRVGERESLREREGEYENPKHEESR
jgi:hypothetical protein